MAALIEPFPEAYPDYKRANEIIDEVLKKRKSTREDVGLPPYIECNSAQQAARNSIRRG